MVWVLVDVLVVLLALAVLAVAGLSVYRRVRALMKQGAAAADLAAQAQGMVASVQAERPAVSGAPVSSFPRARG